MAKKILIQNDDEVQLIPYIKKECIVDLNLCTEINDGLMSFDYKKKIDNLISLTSTETLTIKYVVEDNEEDTDTNILCVIYDEEDTPINGKTCKINQTVTFEIIKGTRYYIGTKTNNDDYIFDKKTEIYKAGNGTSRNIIITFEKPKIGTFIELTNGKLVEVNDFNSSTMTPNSIYHSDGVNTIRIGLSTVSGTKTWVSTRYDNLMLKNYSVSDSKKDYDGNSNTNLILKTNFMYPTYTTLAATSAKEFIFPNGKEGYLPSVGEFDFAYQNRSTINTAMTKVHGTAVGWTTYHWTSTEGTSTGYAYRYYNGTPSQVSKTSAYTVRPFYYVPPKKLSKTGYTQVEYIETSGTQSIYLPHIKGNSNSKFEIDMEFTPNSGNQTLFCSRTSGSSNIFCLFDIQGNIRSDYNTSTTANQFTNDGKRHKYTKDKNLMYVDDVLKTTHTQATFASSYGTMLFASYTTNVTSYSSTNVTKGKLYSFKAWENDELKCDLIPCYRNSDGEIGMYDLVEKTFYKNFGTGTFTKGPDII